MTNNGITEDRLHHMLGVARKAYHLALARGYDETFARKCFLLGLIHDVGREFEDENTHHEAIGAEMLSSVVDTADESISALLYHSFPSPHPSEEWEIITQADLLTSPKGEEVTAEKRVEEVGERFGKSSDEYINLRKAAKQCGLL